VLLSPGTSSFDQFNDYTQRGDVFRELVLQLT
jgi:UDP-N-acetylmuramoylalanine-D-glutamate ligase